MEVLIGPTDIVGTWLADSESLLPNLALMAMTEEPR
jgi:hypothetical protein